MNPAGCGMKATLIVTRISVIPKFKVARQGYGFSKEGMTQLYKKF
jgi:hypothetical protein